MATTTGFPYFPTIMSVREEGGGGPLLVSGTCLKIVALDMGAYQVEGVH